MWERLVGERLSFLKAQKQDHVVQCVVDQMAKHGPVFKTSLIGSKVVVITGQAGNRFVLESALPTLLVTI